MSKIAVQGCIWGVNSFDQWGVELGKILAKDMLSALRGRDAPDTDGSTAGLLAHFQRQRGGGT